ncbi:MAG: Brp/Blh family beta-carotene 15,15'-dioxygenase, partial [Candidatus Puniceispirillaceae bacterium]
SGLMAVLPPLAGFAVYFCLVHSRRHFLSIFSAMRTILPVQIIVRTALGLTVATWLMAGAGYWIQTQYAVAIDEAVLRTVFILLAALTLPHMILVDGLFRPTMRKLLSL